MNATSLSLNCGKSNYQRKYFYNEPEQMNTEMKEYTNLHECVTKLLQVQVDYKSARISAFPEGTDSTKL